MKASISLLSPEESKRRFDNLISDCEKQINNSYISENGRVIWDSIESYKSFNSSLVSRIKVKAKSKIVSKSKTKKKK